LLAKAGGSPTSARPGSGQQVSPFHDLDDFSLLATKFFSNSSGNLTLVFARRGRNSAHRRAVRGQRQCSPRYQVDGQTVIACGCNGLPPLGQKTRRQRCETTIRNEVCFCAPSVRVPTSPTSHRMDFHPTLRSGLTRQSFAGVHRDLSRPVRSDTIFNNVVGDPCPCARRLTGTNKLLGDHMITSTIPKPCTFLRKKPASTRAGVRLRHLDLVKPLIVQSLKLRTFWSALSACTRVAPRLLRDPHRRQRRPIPEPWPPVRCCLMKTFSNPPLGA